MSLILAFALSSALAQTVAPGPLPQSQPEPDIVFPDELVLVPLDVEQAAASAGDAATADVPDGLNPVEEALYRAQIAWVSEDWAIAEQYAETAALGGDSTAAVMAGLIARDGRSSGAPSLADAASWFQRAAAENQPLALYELGRIALEGDGAYGLGSPRTWFGRAARAGHIEAMVELALILKNSPIPQEHASARTWAERAAQQGSAEGMYQYAQLLDLGTGGQQDLVGARQWYERAADSQHGEAALQAAIMWAEGQGGEASDAEALRYMRVSAESGYAPAQGQLGLMLYQGRGVEIDQALASYWFEQGARGGDAESAFLFAYVLARGEGRVQNFEDAFYWSLRARTDILGEPVANPSRDQLEAGLRGVLTPQTVDAIEARVLAGE